eukprot:gene7701-9018_t
MIHYSPLDDSVTEELLIPSLVPMTTISLLNHIPGVKFDKLSSIFSAWLIALSNGQKQVHELDKLIYSYETLNYLSTVFINHFTGDGNTGPTQKNTNIKLANDGFLYKNPNLLTLYDPNPRVRHGREDWYLIDMAKVDIIIFNLTINESITITFEPGYPESEFNEDTWQELP